MSCCVAAAKTASLARGEVGVSSSPGDLWINAWSELRPRLDADLWGRDEDKESRKGGGGAQRSLWTREECLSEASGLVTRWRGDVWSDDGTFPPFPPLTSPPTDTEPHGHVFTFRRLSRSHESIETHEAPEHPRHRTIRLVCRKTDDNLMNYCDMDTKLFRWGHSDLWPPKPKSVSLCRFFIKHLQGFLRRSQITGNIKKNETVSGWKHLQTTTSL